MDDSNKIPDLIIQLSDGLSNHIKASARYWMALALISVITIVSIVPEASNTVINSNNTVTLPFGFGDINQNYFYPFSAVLISLLTISFGASQAQMIRARKLANTVLRATYKDINFSGDIDLRDAFDVINATSINRTAPLAQLILGSHQFYPSKDKQPIIRKIIAITYQAALKTASYLVIYLLPFYALYISFIYGELLNSGNSTLVMPFYFLWVVSGLATLILLQLLCLEIIYSFSAFKRIFNLQNNSEKEQINGV